MRAGTLSVHVEPSGSSTHPCSAVQQPHLLAADKHQARRLAPLNDVDERRDVRALNPENAVLAHRQLERQAPLQRARCREKQCDGLSPLARFEHLQIPPRALGELGQGQSLRAVAVARRRFKLAEVVARGDQPARHMVGIGRVTRVGADVEAEHALTGLAPGERVQLTAGRRSLHRSRGAAVPAA